MLELRYKKSRNGWPLQATAAKLELYFSGTFDPARIAAESVAKHSTSLETAVLWLLSALGVIALAVSGFSGYEQGRWLFLFDHNLQNLTFWVGLLSALYLWAKSAQEGLQEQRLNLLHFGEELKTEGKLDVYQLFNHEAKAAWNQSLEPAKTHGGTPSADDLFLSLLGRDSIGLAFGRLAVDVNDLATVVTNYRKLSGEKAAVQGSLERIPFVAFQEALKLHNKAIDPLMLLCALARELPERHIIQNAFFNLGLSLERLETLSSWLFNVDLLKDELSVFRRLSSLKPDSEINKGLTSVPTPYLDRFSTDLTLKAKYGQLPLALGRQGDLREIFKLFSEGRPNVLIKGAEGTGRTTLVNEIAYKMATEQVPKVLQDKRLVRLEVSGVLGSPTKAETVLLSALNEAAHAGNIVLVIEDVHQLAKAQSTQGLSLLDVLVNYLGQQALEVVATSTLEDYTDYLKPAANFDQTFSSYELQHLPKQGILLACCIRASVLESQYGVFFTYPAIEQAVELTDSYVHGTGQPQKAIGVLVEAATRAKGDGKHYHVVDEALIHTVVSEKTHIPTETLGQNEAEKLLNLEDTLATQVVGQKAAVVAVAEGLRRARSGLVSTARPFASFLFLGPTGVGKTELARALAKHYFGNDEYLLRLDMSEYHGPDGLIKLLGTQESRTDTQLVKHLKNYPFCLLLCDEFEKASTEVHNLFLQVLEDGRLTTGRGETLDLTHTMIIATSNAGALEIQAGIKANRSTDQIKAELFNGPLMKILAPELLNRFDGVIVFEPLTPEEVKQVTQLQLGYLSQQLLEKGMKIRFSEAVASDVAKNAYDPTLGARPVRRYIQDHVEGFIAKLILQKELTRGSEATVDLRDGQLVLS